MSWSPARLCDFVTDGGEVISYNVGIKPHQEINMKRNMSNTDRIVRVLVAALFAYLYFAGIVTGALGIALLMLAGVFTLTALVAFCPLYAPFKFSTFKG